VKLFGKRVSAEVDVVKLEIHEDGRAEEPCWFCGGTVVFSTAGSGDDGALLSIERLGEKPIHGVCHMTCAQRAKGSLSI
jgi:hypothetical protein